MSTKIFFVRHGQVENPKNILYGRLPGFSLSLEGKKQITNAAELLLKQSITAIYSSPLLRAKESAKIIGGILRLPIKYSNDILEIKSSMQGKTFDYLLSRFVKLDIFASQKNGITGETMSGVSERMQKFIEEVTKKHKGENIVALTHGDPIMIVKAKRKKMPMKISSIRPIKGYIRPGEIYVVKFNFQ